MGIENESVRRTAPADAAEEDYPKPPTASDAATIERDELAEHGVRTLKAAAVLTGSVPGEVPSAV